MTSTTTTSAASAPVSSPRFAPIPFGRLLRVEWAKAIGTRSARYLLGTCALVAVAIMAIPLSFPDDVDQTWTNYLTFTGLTVSIFLPVVAVMTLTTEWTQRTVLVTFTLEPRRGRVLAAKVVVSLLLGLVAGVLALGVTVGSVGIAEGLGRDVTSPTGAAPLVGFLPFVLLNMLWGSAFGAVLHNTAAAITLLFVLPTVWSAIAVGAFDTVGEWLDPSQGFGWMLEGTVDEHAAQFATSTTLWIVVPLALGLLRTLRREVS